MNIQLEDPIEAVRHFTRFYTGRIGVLKDKLLDSAFSLTEARVVFELGHARDLTAKDLAQSLSLDPGYLSRLLAGLKKRGVISQTPSEEDRRRQILSLTESGEAALAEMEARSRTEIGAVLAPLEMSGREELVGHLKAVETLLGGAAEPASGRPSILRPHRNGDLSWVLARQAALYAEEYGWDQRFEAYLLKIGAEFHQKYDPKRDCLWVAEKDGRVAGSAAIVDDGGDTARLRIVYVEPWTRGLGLGRALVAACLDTARTHGYRRMTLNTFSLLKAAGRIYKEAGFEVVEQADVEAFGFSMTEQEWARTL